MPPHSFYVNFTWNTIRMNTSVKNGITMLWSCNILTFSSVSWNEASKACEARRKVLFQPWQDFDDFLPFFRHALNHARHTGTYTTHVLLLQLPKIVKVRRFRVVRMSPITRYMRFGFNGVDYFCTDLICLFYVMANTDCFGVVSRNSLDSFYKRIMNSSNK